MMKYEKFRQAILQVITESEMDVGMVLYILRDIVREIEVLYSQQLQKEAKQDKEISEQESD